MGRQRFNVAILIACMQRHGTGSQAKKRRRIPYVSAADYVRARWVSANRVNGRCTLRCAPVMARASNAHEWQRQLFRCISLK
jgi:hypothetical protein